MDALKNSALATFAKLSFAVTSPGVVASDDQINRFLGDLRPGVAPTIADSAAFKRILVESQTLMMHSFKATDRGEEPMPKKMSAPERQARPHSHQRQGSRKCRKPNYCEMTGRRSYG